MDPITIKHDNKTLAPLLVMLAAGLIGLTWFIFFSGRVKYDSSLTIWYSLMIAATIYILYIPAIRVLKKETVFIFSKTGLELNNKGKSISLLWAQVISWSIEREEEDDSRFLIIQTNEKRHRIFISRLDKTPGEIEALMHLYKKL